MNTMRIYMFPCACGLLASFFFAFAAVVKPWPPAPPQVARLDVEEVYQFDEGAPTWPRPIRAGEDVLIFDFGDEGVVPGDGEAKEWRRP